MKFSLTRDCRVILYGHNKVCERMLGNFMRNDFKVSAIIDKKFEGKEEKLFPSIKLLNPDDDLKEYVDDIVVICLNNGMRHREIAETLANKGFTKIIYLPMDDLTTKDDARALRRAFGGVLDGDFDSVCDIPYYQKNNGDIVKMCNNSVVFWCDIKYVYTFDAQIVNNRTEGPLVDKKRMLLKYCDIPLSLYLPYVNVFKYLAGEDVNIEEYLEIQRSDRAEKEKLLEDRRRLYQTYEYWQKYDTDFFVSCPTIAVYNEKLNCFNVEDGLHRASYLISKGYEKVPIVVNKKSYEIFLSKLKGSSQYAEQ